MTTPPSLPPDEPLRLRSLRSLNLVETPLEERFERITRLARSLLDVDISAISLVEADRQFFKSIQGLDVCGTSRDVSFCGHTILGDDVYVVPDAREDERFAANPLVTGPPHIVAYASMPLRSPDGLKVGAICVIHRSARQFTQEELQHLRDLAGLAELELQSAAASAVQAALVEEVSVEHRKTLVDPLTRMWNRDGITMFAEEALDRSRAGSSGVAVVMVDLDHFKQINDTMGHAAGDEALRVAARRMLGAIRETDAIGRIGGDEFLCVLADCQSNQDANDVARRVHERLTEGPVTTDAGSVTLTASMGVAFFDGSGEHQVSEIILESGVLKGRAGSGARRRGGDTAV